MIFVENAMLGINSSKVPVSVTQTCNVLQQID